MEERVQFRPDAGTDPQSIPFGEANPLRTGPARDNLSEKTMFQGVTMDAISIIAECGDEQEKVRQMKKLEVVIARIKARHPNAPVLGDGSPYYERVVSRITVNKKD